MVQAVDGISEKGLQLLGILPFNTLRFVNVYVRFRPLGERLVRRGTVLVCYRGGASLLPVTQALKLYGDGLTVVASAAWTPANLEVWVNWFASGFEWRLETNDPL